MHNFRHGARALLLDEQDRVLLCRLSVGPALIVWAAPGGGVEPGETAQVALRRELREELGLTVAADPPHVWRQQVAGPDYAPGHDGVLNDYFLIRTTAFTPRGTMSDDELAAENITGFRWWRLAEIADYEGPDLFSPRDLATPLAALISGVPDQPLLLGL